MDETTEEKKVDQFVEPMSAAMLYKGIQKMQNVFGGVSNPEQVAKRRAKNKVAKQSRRKNRR